MKKTLSIVVALSMALTLLAGCGGGTPSGGSPSGGNPSSGNTSSGNTSSNAGSGATESWTPSDTVTWIVTSSAGGGSDIYTRKIQEIVGSEGLNIVSQTIVVDNQTDGSGEVGRNKVATTRAGNAADHTLLTFNSGDLMPMCKNTDNRVENFTPLAVMAVDKQLIFRGEHTSYKTFAEVIAAVTSGTPVVIGGSKGDDIATYEALCKELGIDETMLKYITYDSTGDAITALLGGHVELLISKPAAASQYVEAGSIEAILALSTERYGGNLAGAPTLSEVDSKYSDVEVPVWRGVVGPANMSPEAAAYWSDVLKQVSESDAWKNDYLDKNMLISNYMDLTAAKDYMTQYQADYLVTIGKDK